MGQARRRKDPDYGKLRQPEAHAVPDNVRALMDRRNISEHEARSLDALERINLTQPGTIKPAVMEEVQRWLAGDRERSFDAVIRQGSFRAEKIDPPWIE